MPRIDNDVKLDFKDVLLRPKRSTLKSRADVNIVYFTIALSMYQTAWNFSEFRYLLISVGYPSTDTFLLFRTCL